MTFSRHCEKRTVIAYDGRFRLKPGPLLLQDGGDVSAFRALQIFRKVAQFEDHEVYGHQRIENRQLMGVEELWAAISVHPIAKVKPFPLLR